MLAQCLTLQRYGTDSAFTVDLELGLKGRGLQQALRLKLTSIVFKDFGQQAALFCASTWAPLSGLGMDRKIRPAAAHIGGIPLGRTVWF